MSDKRTGWVAGLGAAVVGAGVLVAHQAGMLVDDAARVATKVGPGVDDVLNDPSIPAAVKQAVTTFRDLRKEQTRKSLS